jgi:NAD(P)-dependent dehydrogenase (short-subunit alcohol dehydrogenase family)
VVGVAADLGTPEGTDALVQAAERAFGRVDVLVNNAAIAPRATLDRMEEGVFERVVAVNLTGPYRLCRRLAPGMAARGYGRIVNVSAISGTLGTPGFTAYCASKWGLNGLTQALSEELKGKGVFVTAVLPGTVRTEMSKDLGFPVQMEPEDVAELVRYLCAQAPKAMTGGLVEMFG